jgi:hypothetical protein
MLAVALAMIVPFGASGGSAAARSEECSERESE